MGWLVQHLSRFGAVGAVLAALCCVGFSALLSLLSAIGLGFLINDAILLPVLAVFLGVYVTGLFIGLRRHGSLAVLLAGVASAAATFIFIFVVFVEPLAYASIALLVAVSVWDLIARKRAVRTAVAR